MNKKIEKAALSHKGARQDFKEEWDAFRYLVDDKMFAMVAEDNLGRKIITLKLDPQHGELLRKTYPEQIFPGYYMNKIHWNSFLLETPVDDKILAQCIEEAYTLIFSSLSKKRQKEITEA